MHTKTAGFTATKGMVVCLHLLLPLCVTPFASDSWGFAISYAEKK
jgi:hypothetical protein